MSDTPIRDRFDASLAAAFQDVPVPAGLEDRLLAQLASETAGEGPGAMEEGRALTEPTDRVQEVSGPDAAALCDPTVAPAIESRRRCDGGTSGRWLRRTAAMAGLAVVVLACVVLFLLSRSGTGPGTINLADAVDQFTRDEDAKVWGTGQALDRAPNNIPVSPLIVYSQSGSTWRFARFQGFDGVAYDLRGWQGTRATLYVVQGQAKNVPSFPPAVPGLATANCAVAAWQEGDLLYVLVVRGSSQEYQQFLQDTGAPLT